MTRLATRALFTIGSALAMALLGACISIGDFNLEQVDTMTVETSLTASDEAEK